MLKFVFSVVQTRCACRPKPKSVHTFQNDFHRSPNSPCCDALERIRPPESTLYRANWHSLHRLIEFKASRADRFRINCNDAAKMARRDTESLLEIQLLSRSEPFGSPCVANDNYGERWRCTNAYANQLSRGLMQTSLYLNTGAGATQKFVHFISGKSLHNFPLFLSVCVEQLKAMWYFIWIHFPPRNVSKERRKKQKKQMNVVLYLHPSRCTL